MTTFTANQNTVIASINAGLTTAKEIAAANPEMKVQAINGSLASLAKKGLASKDENKVWSLAVELQVKEEAPKKGLFAKIAEKFAPSLVEDYVAIVGTQLFEMFDVKSMCGVNGRSVRRDWIEVIGKNGDVIQLTGLKRGAKSGKFAVTLNEGKKNAEYIGFKTLEEIAAL